MSPCSSSDWRPRRCRVCADALRPEWTHRQTFRANPRARLGSITLSFLRGCCLSGTSSKDNYPVGGENPAFTHAPLDAGTRQFVVKGQCARLARGADSVNRWRPRSNLRDRKSTRLNSSHTVISYAVFCLKKKTTKGNWDVSTHIESSVPAGC